MPKTKQQEAQEKRLQRNIRQAKKTRADAKTSGNKTVRTRPPKKGGFFAGEKSYLSVDKCGANRYHESKPTRVR